MYTQFVNWNIFPHNSKITRLLKFQKMEILNSKFQKKTDDRMIDTVMNVMTGTVWE